MTSEVGSSFWDGCRASSDGPGVVTGDVVQTLCPEQGSIFRRHATIFSGEDESVVKKLQESRVSLWLVTNRAHLCNGRAERSNVMKFEYITVLVKVPLPKNSPL